MEHLRKHWLVYGSIALVAVAAYELWSKGQLHATAQHYVSAAIPDSQDKARGGNYGVPSFGVF